MVIEREVTERARGIRNACSVTPRSITIARLRVRPALHAVAGLVLSTRLTQHSGAAK